MRGERAWEQGWYGDYYMQCYLCSGELVMSEYYYQVVTLCSVMYIW